MELEFKVDEKAFKKVEELFGYILGDIAADVGRKVYNHVISDGPLWSGAYASSWQLDAGYVIPQGKFQGSKEQYDRPDPIEDFAAAPYAPVFVSNYVMNSDGTHYAGLIEYEGTKTSNNMAWEVAQYARNTIIRTYKYSPKLY